MNNIARSGDSWSDLPNDLLTIIGDRLNTRIDILRLRAVCSAWRSTIPIYNNNTNSLLLPMELPLPRLGQCLCAGPYVSTLVETILYLIEPLDWDKFDSNFIGGLLIKAREVRPNEFSLLNLNASKMSLPRKLNLLHHRVFELGKFYGLIERSTLEKTIFSTEHNSLLAIIHGELTYFAFGDEKWSKLGDRSHSNHFISEFPKFRYTDIITYKSQFHAIDNSGSLVSFNASDLDITRFSGPLYTDDWQSDRGLEGGLMKLMEGYGDLYVVVGPPTMNETAMLYDIKLNQYIYNDGRRQKTMPMYYFRIYKFNEDKNDWVKVESLGDKLIILSANDSLIASAGELAGFRGNCIYFAEQDLLPQKEFSFKRNSGFSSLQRMPIFSTILENLK